MRKTWLMLTLVWLLIPFVATAGPSTMIIVGGRGTSAVGGGGPTYPVADGVEVRATQLNSLGVAVCSEPLNGNETISSDPTSSTDTLECWGRSSPWQANDFETPQPGPSAVTAWGSFAYAMNTNQKYLWLYGWNPNSISSSTRSINYRFYKQISSDYAATCTTVRNKLIQFALWGQQVQIEEGQGNETCTTSTNYPIYISIDNGPGTSTDWGAGFGQAPFSPSVTQRDCLAGPCMIEGWVEGNLLAGTDIYYKARIIDSSGVVHTASAGPIDLSSSWSGKAGSAAGSRFLWGGDLFHSGGGTARIGAYMSAAFDYTGTEIGCSKEIVGTTACP